MSVNTRPVPVHILRWPKIRDLITQQKFIYTYLYFNSDTSACGCYLLGIDSGAADLSMTSSSLEDALLEFVRRGLVERDKETGEILILDWPRWHLFNTPAARGALWASINKIQSKKLWITIKRAYESIPEPGKGKDKGKVKASSNEEEAIIVPSPSKNPASTSLQNIKTQQPCPQRSLSGIRCWTNDDQNDATLLQEKYGMEKVIEAVKLLELDDIEPFPSRVRSLLQKQHSGLQLPSNWWSTDQGTNEVGRILKLNPHMGESMECFRQRIREAIALEKRPKS